MGKADVLNDAKKFLSESYEDDECKEIIRSSLLGLRKRPLRLTSFIKNRSLKKYKDRKHSVTKIQFVQNINKMSTYKKQSYTEFMYSVGCIVWSKLFFCESWPAIIIGADMCGQKETSFDKCWVFWFGDHKISEVFKSKVYDFQKYYEKYYNPKNTKNSYVNGIYEALKECWIRINKSDSIIERNNLLRWSLDEFLNVQMFKDQSYIGPAVPEWVILVLNKYSMERNEDMGYECTHLEKHNERNFARNSDLCMACKVCFGQNAHPFFHGYLCSPCRDRLMDVIFIFDSDGFNTFCIICACSGELFLCDEDGCNKAYCSACFMFFIGEANALKIKRKDVWLCFLCTIEQDYTLRARSEWREYLSLMFQPNPAIIPVNKLCMRVLSLFDGIATGKIVLDELNIKLEIYYASEIDTDSLLVSKMRHSGGRVQWIGDVTSISFDKLCELGPIDLLIGGSPCNDFSIANPSRKGLYEDGTGVLFYEFYRILCTLRELQTPGQPLFWMFENVASMQKHCRSTISKFFNCYPALLDAKYFSAQKRPRLFWGNIPGMYCPPQYSRPLCIRSLDDSLFPGRKSQVEKIKTVTTKVNSLMQYNKNEMPVMMDDSESMFWLPELERIFGFPDHYTDVGDLSRNRRQKLIGQAWSVHVVKHILSPLKDIYEVEEHQNK